MSINFFEISETRQGVRYSITPTTVGFYLSGMGFRKVMNDLSIIFVKIDGQIIQNYSREHLYNWFIEHIKHEFQFTNEIEKTEVQNLMANAQKKFISGEYYQFIETLKVPLLNDTRDITYFFLSNKIVKITKDNFEIKDYKDYPEYFFYKDQIRPYTFNNYYEAPGMYEDHVNFFTNFTNDTVKSKLRFDQYCRMRGYLFNNYCDEFPKAIFICDSDKDNKGGGNYKSKGVRDLSYCKHIDEISGSSERLKDPNRYALINKNLQILLIDDIHQNFDSRQIIEEVDKGILVRNKYEKPFFIGGINRPKIVLTSNFSFKNDTSAIKRRYHIVEISQNYNDNFSPLDRYKKLFFSAAWTQKDWDDYFSFEIRCAQNYLKNGLASETLGNFVKKQILNTVGEDFQEYFSEKFLESIVEQCERDTVNEHYIPSEPIFNGFKNQAGSFYKNINGRKLKDFFALVCKELGFEYKSKRKSVWIASQPTEKFDSHGNPIIINMPGQTVNAHYFNLSKIFTGTPKIYNTKVLEGIF